MEAANGSEGGSGIQATRAAPLLSTTHEIAVFQHDNGELGEDVVRCTPAADEGVETGTGSFPASDAPATWSGTDHRDREPRDRELAVRLDRVRGTTPLPDTVGRPHP